MSGNGPSLPLLIPIPGLAPLALPVQSTDKVVVARGSVAFRAGPTDLFSLSTSFAISSGGVLNLVGGTAIALTAPTLAITVGTITLSGAITVSGNLTVDGTSALNGNTVVTGTLQSTGSATLGSGSANEIVVAGAAAASGPTLTATGSDTNIDINVVPKGTGSVKSGRFVATDRFSGPEFQIDTNYYLTISTDPFINMDANDFIAYRRSTNKFDFAIGGVTEFTIDATGITATGSISAAGGTFSTISTSGALSAGSTATLHRAIVETDVTMLSIGGPRITAGTGAPASTVPKGTIFLRTDGAVGSTLYVSQGGGVWNPVAGV